MPSTSSSLRPGVSQGAYPQREEAEENLADKLAARISAQLRSLRARRNLTVTSIASLINDAECAQPLVNSPDFPDYLQQLKNQLFSNGLENKLVAQAFAVIRSTAETLLGMRHYDVQLLAAWGLVQGYMVEMGTGEGKSLTATLAAGCAGLAGIPVHVITTNEYLAERDADEMQPLYSALGLSCSVVKEDMSAEQRRAAYACDVVYCTNKQVAFDYLRDRLVVQNETSQLALRMREFDVESGPVLRGLCFAIVDEADSVLIDEACTPLLLSREVSDPDREELYKSALNVASNLIVGTHFELHAGEMKLTLNEAGRSQIHSISKTLNSEGFNGLWRGKRRREWLVQQALQAVHLYRADEHYLVRDNRIEIIDPNTGRTMPDRAWQQGLHQMVECKEGCILTGQRETLARISYQRFYLRYLHLSGMSGTLQEVAGELQGVYGKGLLVVPSHRPRKVRNDGRFLYETSEQKWSAIIERVKHLRSNGQPVLLGTASVASSERLSRLLEQERLAHVVLSARQDAQEASVISGAGLKNAVTVATNMAGRGTDIKLGDGVERLGGLHVIACEPNQSARVDRQLFGRCGRQGQVGSFEMYVSLEDQLVSNYLPPMALKMANVGRQASEDSTQFVSRLVTKLPQRAIQARLRAIRRQVLKHDRQMEELLSFSGNSE